MQSIPFPQTNTLSCQRHIMFCIIFFLSFYFLFLSYLKIQDYIDKVKRYFRLFENNFDPPTGHDPIPKLYKSLILPIKLQGNLYCSCGRIRTYDVALAKQINSLPPSASRSHMNLYFSIRFY